MRRGRLPAVLLAYLRAHTGQTLTRGQLSIEVWGVQYFRASRTVDQTVSIVRRRLPPGESVVTVFRAGYRHEFTDRARRSGQGAGPGPG